MSSPNTEWRDEFGPGHDATTGDVSAHTSADPYNAADPRPTRISDARSRLSQATAQIGPSAVPTVRRWFNRVAERAAPVIDRARAYPAYFGGTLVAAVAVLAASRHRRTSEPVIYESTADLGNWHVIGEPHRMDKPR